jgi:hypothetical protein
LVVFPSFGYLPFSLLLLVPASPFFLPLQVAFHDLQRDSLDRGWRRSAKMPLENPSLDKHRLRQVGIPADVSNVHVTPLVPLH